MLLITDHGSVREIRMCRPPANAFNPDLVKALTEAVADARESAEAVVISGSPGMFSAGLDVPELLQLERDRLSRFWQDFMGLLGAVARMPIPVAFALNGHAPAGGIVLALFGDYRIMAGGNFKTGFNEVQVGLVVPPVVHKALVRLIGAHQAERITVAGEIMDAERALGIGLIDELADDPEAVVERAIEWSRQHLALPRYAMLQSRKMARADLHGLFADGSELRVDRFVELWFRDATQKTLKQLVARLSGA
jgi:enoyl-CoA hydratase/carnithine racemase